MSIAESSIHPVAPAADANWHMVEDGFWVGNAFGMFLGTIECHEPDRFFARNAARAYVGEYSTFEAATEAVRARLP